jgi:hypothetical protein
MYLVLFYLVLPPFSSCHLPHSVIDCSFVAPSLNGIVLRKVFLFFADAFLIVLITSLNINFEIPWNTCFSVIGRISPPSTPHWWIQGKASLRWLSFNASENDLKCKCRGANRRNRYTENPPNCMGGIREFNCACWIVSLLLALLPNTTTSAILSRIISWSLHKDL